MGIYSIAPVNGSFRCGDRVVDADWIWTQYESAMERGFVVEEKARNHAILDAVNPDSFYLRKSRPELRREPGVLLGTGHTCTRIT